MRRAVMTRLMVGAEGDATGERLTGDEEPLGPAGVESATGTGAGAGALDAAVGLAGAGVVALGAADGTAGAWVTPGAAA